MSFRTEPLRQVFALCEKQKMERIIDGSMLTDRVVVAGGSYGSCGMRPLDEDAGLVEWQTSTTSSYDCEPYSQWLR